MSGRENFKQAAKDLFGLDAQKRAAVKDDPTIAQYMQEPESYSPGPIPETPGAAEASAQYDQYAPYAAAPPAYNPVEQYVEQTGDYAVVDSHKETTVISKGTTIVGRVRTEGHIDIRGRIEGNVDADGNVAVNGKVSGHIKGNHIELYGCQVKGNITAVTRIFVSNDTVIIGDLQSQNIVFDGRIKGNISATDNAVLNGNTYLLGDISAANIAIESGAIVNGMIRTTVDINEDEALFDSF